MFRRVAAVAAAAVPASAIFATTYCNNLPEPSSITAPDVRRLASTLPYGIPSRENVKVRGGYVLSYNRRLRNANWACEVLTPALIKKKNADRGNSKFVPDLSVPEQFRATLNDFRKSGYDRGHLVPARDMGV